MTRQSAWRERLWRCTLLTRAVLDFFLSAPHRRALFERLADKNAPVLTADSLGRTPPPVRSAPRIDLLFDQARPRITIVAPDRTAPSVSGELVAAIARADVGLRFVTTEAAASEQEAPFRIRLEKEHGLPRAAQARIEILDGASRPIPCARDDVFVAMDRRCAALLTQALAERNVETKVYCLAGEEAAPLDWTTLPASYPGCVPVQLDGGLDQISERLSRELHARSPAALELTPPYTSSSTHGLCYRIAKPPPPNFAGRRVCLFVHFDPDDRLDPYVVRYLSALKDSGLDTILISSSDLDSAAISVVEPLLSGAICRQNIGFDFSGWALALEVFPQVYDCDEIIIANDSVYGPVGDLDGLFAQMEMSSFDIWGATENLQIEKHLQSWFVCFRKLALRSEIFRSFWEQVLPLTDKQAIIENYEIPILRNFAAKGFSVGAVVTCKSTGILYRNPTMYGWRSLLNLGSPFVKVELLRDNPGAVTIAGWSDEVASYGYPPHLILDHLRRVAGRGAAGLKTR